MKNYHIFLCYTSINFQGGNKMEVIATPNTSYVKVKLDYGTNYIG